MAKTIFFIIVYLIFISNCAAQKCILQLGIEKGINKVLHGAPIKETRIGNSASINTSLGLKGQHQRISFHSVFSTAQEVYSYRLDKIMFLHIKQVNLRITPLAGMMVKKNQSLKVGFFIQKLLRSGIEIKFKDQFTVNSSYGTNEFFITYEPEKWQAGFQVEYDVCFGRKEITSLQFVIRQFATPFLTSTYTFNKSGALDQQVETFNNNAKATEVLIGLAFKINHLFTKNKSETDPQ